MRGLSRVAPDVLSATAVAGVLWVAFGGHAFLNYDSFYALAWGEELLEGRRPDYGVPVAPTPHPLALAAGTGLALLGDRAEPVALALVVLAVGALGVAVARLGQVLFSWPVGVLAAVVVLTRVPILNFGIRGYVDLPALALVVWAAVLEARRARRGAGVLVLLALAGLLRPEAWLLAAAYWLWLAPALGPAGRLRAAALAAAAPLTWALSDLAITGDPLWSLRGTSALAGQLERPTGLAALPRVAPFRLGEILRLPELVAAVLGLAAGLAWLRRAALLPIALGALNAVAYTAFALAGLPLLGRYLFLGATMLALFAGLAVFGWWSLERGHAARAGWRLGGLVLLAVLLVFVPVQARRLNDLRVDIAARDRIQDDLLALVRARPGAQALASCRPLWVPNHRPVPSLAYWTDRRPSEIVSAQLRPPPRAALFLAPSTPEVERLSILDPRDPGRLSAEVPGRYRLVARNRSWLLYSGCG